MYIRETIHSAKSSKKCKNGTENNNYVITTKSCLNAGINEKTGSDKKFYKTRIGLNYYWMDVNGYQYKTKTNENGEIERISEDTKDIRNDLKLKGGAPENPVYIPYKALTTKYVSNLINCGYGINASSMAWAEIRVIPNLCVLGDAAGIIGALSIEKNIAPLYFKKKEIKDVQNKLKELGARIDK